MEDSEFQIMAMVELDKSVAKMEKSGGKSASCKVGAVVAKDGLLLSTGFRGEEFGSDGKPVHAERVAMAKLSVDQLAGSTLYSTLEPCVEVIEKQPPSCSTLSIDSKIKRVVIGVLDPRGDIYTKGWKRLITAGIAVDFFPEEMKAKISSRSFKDVETDVGYGPSGTRPTRVTPTKEYTIYKDRNSLKAIVIKWQVLQHRTESGTVSSVDCIIEGGGNHCIVETNKLGFDELKKDWRELTELSNNARFEVGKKVAVLHAPQSEWAILLKVKSIREDAIEFQWLVCE